MDTISPVCLPPFINVVRVCLVCVLCRLLLIVEAFVMCFIDWLCCLASIPIAGRLQSDASASKL